MVRFALGIGAMAMALPATALARSASAIMEVRLVVEPSCHVSAMPLAFAAGRVGQPMDAASEIQVACNDDTPVAVRLDGGLDANGGNRRLTGEAGQVEYSIYSDPARTLRWNAGEAMTGTAGATPLTLAAYGRIDPGATLSASGAYRDSIIVTVDF